jgi:uncharacterized lipoprotein
MASSSPLVPRLRSATAAKAILAVLALGVLAGCAADPRYKQGLEWVQWQESERRRLTAEGFPQYNWH